MPCSHRKFYSLADNPSAEGNSWSVTLPRPDPSEAPRRTQTCSADPRIGPRIFAAPVTAVQSRNFLLEWWQPT